MKETKNSTESPAPPTVDADTNTSLVVSAPPSSTPVSPSPDSTPVSATRTLHRGAGPLTPLEAQLRRTYASVCWTHKIQEKAADRCLDRLRLLQWTQIIVSALTGCGVASLIFSDGIATRLWACISSVVTLVVSSLMKGTDPGGAAQKHRSTAAMLWSIRESYLSLITDIHSDLVSDAEAAKRRDKLQAELASVHKDSPSSSKADAKEAGLALKHRDESSYDDAEINSFLPPILHRRER